MDIKNIDYTFLTWLIPTIISIIAVFRSYQKDINDIFIKKTEIEDSLNNTNFEQAVKLRDIYEKEVNTLLEKISNIKQENECLIQTHEKEIINARKAYEELGRFKMEFDNLRSMLVWYMEAAKTLHEQLIKNGITPVIKIPKDIDNSNVI